MVEFTSPTGSVPPIPDNVSLSQFLLDAEHSMRPLRSADIPWFVDDATGRQVSGEEVRAWTDALAWELKERWNIKEDDVVMIMSPNHIYYPMVIWATHRLGGIVSCANPSYTPPELTHQTHVTRSTLIFTSPSLLSTVLTTGISPSRIVLFDDVSPEEDQKNGYVSVREIIERRSRKSARFVERTMKGGEGKTKVAFLGMSSGTTGKPKAIVVSHYALIAGLLQMCAAAKVGDPSREPEQNLYRPGQVVLGVLPLYRTHGRCIPQPEDFYALAVVLNVSIFCGATCVIVSRYNFGNMLQSIERYRVNHLYIVPPMAVLLCKRPEVNAHDLTSVRLIICGGAPFSAELTERLNKILPCASFGLGYGMTEVCGAISWPHLDGHRGTPGNSGVLIPGMIARVVKPDGTDATYGEAGHLLVNSPSLASGYLDNESATRESFIDGWLHTGDEVVINEKMEVFVKDRIKEFLKVRAFQVAPAELEAHLHEHVAVDDVCVVGVPDEYSGELPYAFVVLSRDARARIALKISTETALKDELMKHVSSAKTSYKHIVGVRFVEAIPKNPSGKLLRRVVREEAKELLAQGKLVVKAVSKL